MKLKVVLEQGEDGWFVVSVPALPGCISQGRTREEAVNNIKEAAEGWLEVMQDLKTGKLAPSAESFVVAI